MDGKCIIIAAGFFDGLREPIAPDDFVIAADAGYTACRENGIVPNLVVGDFDSLGAQPDFPEVIAMPVEKDDTDTLHAIRLGLERGYTAFEIYGGTGGARADHTLANLQCLLFLVSHAARGRLWGEGIVYRVIHNETLRFDSAMRGTVSVFCLDGAARGVYLRGLKYPLTDATLTSDFPLGVSNSFTGESAEITVRDGTLIIVHDIFK